MATAVPGPATEPVLEARDLRKQFGGVTALAGVDFILHPGSIHGLVGQNGAGKSTLVKILNGVHAPDAGTLAICGEPVELRSAADAQARGIAMVFQEFSLVSTLTVAQNVFLGDEPRTPRGLVDDRAAEEATHGQLAELGVDIAPSAIVGRLPVGAQQLVEIAKAMVRRPSILILDEPTASLTHGEVETLFGVLRRLRSRGVSIVFISHHLNEVLAICDEVTVLRDGRVMLTGSREDLSLDRIVVAMTGTHGSAVAGGVRAISERAALEVRDLRLGTRVDGVSFSVRHGEVLGIAGLLGSGRTSLLRAVTGLEPRVDGTILLDGRPVAVDSPVRATRLGIAYVPEDRRRDGIIEGQSVEANLLLSVWSRLTRYGLISGSAVRARARELIDQLSVRTSGPTQPIQQLSGGNQQKVVVGRALALEPGVLLLDDPTAGIDIASRRELLARIRAFADAGHAVVLVSSELEELGDVCDRVLVLRRGRVARTIGRAAGDELSESALLAAIHADPEDDGSGSAGSASRPAAVS